MLVVGCVQQSGTVLIAQWCQKHGSCAHLPQSHDCAASGSQTAAISM